MAGGGGGGEILGEGGKCADKDTIHIQHKKGKYSFKATIKENVLFNDTLNS